MSDDAEAFIRAQTAVSRPPLVPEIALHLAGEITPIWHATEATLARDGVPPPFWAFCWPGGQALARHLLDRPETVRDMRVLDFAAGGGVAAIAAAKAGAAHIAASEVDAHAVAAMHLNAALNGVAIDVTNADLTTCEAAPWDVVLAGDVCYERPMAETAMAWLRRRAAAGATVLLADPGRAFLPTDGLDEVAAYDVPTSRELEDREVRRTVIWHVVG